MSILIYSTRCQHCMKIIEFIQANPPLAPMVNFHDVNKMGVPEQHRASITSVPTLITTNGKMLVGSEVHAWLESLLPTEISQHNTYNSTLGADCDYFEMNMYGQSLQPPLTPHLEKKINADVSGGSYTQLK